MPLYCSVGAGPLPNGKEFDDIDPWSDLTTCIHAGGSARPPDAVAVDARARTSLRNARASDRGPARLRSRVSVGAPGSRGGRARSR